MRSTLDMYFLFVLTAHKYCRWYHLQPPDTAMTGGIAVDTRYWSLPLVIGILSKDDQQKAQK